MDQSLFLMQLATRYSKKPGPVTLYSSFDELGMGPYEVLDFMLKVEEEYGIAMDDFELLSVRTIADVQDAVARCMNHA